MGLVQSELQLLVAEHFSWQNRGLQVEEFGADQRAFKMVNVFHLPFSREHAKLLFGERIIRA